MKAVVFKEARKLVVEDVPTPEAGPDEVLIKVKVVGICGSDLHLYQYGFLPPNYIMGHEATGTIVSIGDGVADFEEGERVWLAGGAACGTCDFCLEGKPEVCRNPLSLGTGALPGAYAEYVKAPTRFLTRLPDDIGMREAALMDPIGCAHHPVNLSGIKPGESALVMGAGPIGLFVLHYLKQSGIDPVILSEPVRRRAELGRELGANVILNPTSVSIEDEVKKITRDVGPDVVYECVGIPSTTLDSVSLVRRCGTVVWVGVCMEQVTFVPALWFFKRVTIHLSLGMGKRDAIPGYLEFIRDNREDVMKVITETISLDEVPEAFERLSQPNTEAKILVEFD
jgi:(R,R)-butanediol dehydrogenase/meso-butanediol dehydrogenase/diacetyl reductase